MAKIEDDRAERLRWIESISKLMDNQFRVPGTDLRFGLDPLLGFFPVVGDLASFAVSAGLLLTMARHGVSRKVVILMALNILLDATIGSIPILGNIFDFAFKANERNVNLLRRHYVEGKYQGTGTWILVTIIAVVFVLILLLGYLLWRLIFWLVGLF
ncbi:hypothetical protein BH24BAC1_BH24BAC1_03790 [soil metagenome]|jgi:hypothetical protein